MKLRKLLVVSTMLAAASMVPGHAAVKDNPHFKVLGLVIVWGADGFDSTSGSPIVGDFVIDNGDDAATSAGARADSDLISDDVFTVVTGTLTATTGSYTGSSAFDVVDFEDVQPIDPVTGLPAVDPVTGDPVFVRQSSTLDASAAFSAFNLQDDDTVVADNTIQSSFFVASNTGFGIDAVASVVGTADTFTLADIGWGMGVTQSGTNGSLTFGGAAQNPTGAGGVNPSIDTLADLATPQYAFYGSQRTAASRGTIVEQSVRFDVTYTLGGTSGYDLSMGAGEIEADVTYTVFVP